MEEKGEALASSEAQNTLPVINLSYISKLLSWFEKGQEKPSIKDFMASYE